MSSINTNVSAMIANANLAKSQQAMGTSLQRLSTGLQINSGADNPSGLIASQGLQSEMQGITQAISNSQQATNVISTADGALSEVSNLLTSIKSLIVQAANTGAMTPQEIQANQLQVDSAVQSITRISNTTSFAGLNLLNGSLGYVTSGVPASALHDVNITNASFGTNTSVPVAVNVLASAAQGNLQFRASSISASVTLTVAGNTGVQTLSFVSGTKSSAIAYAVNSVSNSTGVTAAMNNPANAASGIHFTSGAYGSNQFVSVQALEGTFNTVSNAGAAAQRVSGKDAVATINGAKAIGNGLNITLNSANLSVSMNLDPKLGLGSKTFTITGGGALFQLGADVNGNEQANIGISSVAASQLGNVNDGYLTDIITGGKSSLVSGNTQQASNILNDAIGQVSFLRGRLGAFEANTLQTNMNSLQVALQNVTSSNSNIADTNFASETSNLTRAQILTQAGVSVLATANSTPQYVLKLLP